MIAPLLADAGFGPLFRDPTVSLAGLLVLLVVVSLVEALVLSFFKLASFAKSALWSVVMNVVSTVVGVLFSTFVSFPTLGATIAFVGVGIFALLYLIVTCLVSILTEAGVLLILGWQPRKKVWTAVAVANAVTYAVPTLLVVILIFIRR